MARSNRPPEPAYILARKDEAIERDAKRNAKFDEIERMRFRQYEVPIPPRFEYLKGHTVKTPLVDDLLRTVSTGITSSFPVFSVPPQKETKEAQNTSSLHEKWLTAVVQKLDRAGGRHRAWVDEIDQAVMFGLACPKILYLPDAWDNEYLSQREQESDADYLARKDEYQHGAPLPFAWLTPDPRTYHDWSEYRKIVEVLEISKRTRNDLAKRYGNSGIRFDANAGYLKSKTYGEPVAESALGSPGLSTQIEFITYTDKRWITYMADGLVLDRIEHKCNRVNYFPYFGLSTSSRSPEYEAVGIADDILELVKAYDLFLTMQLQHGYLTAFPMGTYRRPPGTGMLVDLKDNPLVYVEFEPGVFKVLNEGDEMGWMVAPPTNGEMVQVSGQLRELIDRISGVPDVLRGIAEKTATAWGQAQQLMVATRRIFDPITDNLAISMAERAEFLLWLVERRLGETVYALADRTTRRGKQRGWLGLGPGDIKGYYSVSVDITTLTPDRRIQEGQFGLQQQQAGAISMKMHRSQFLHIGAPEEEERQVLVEKFRGSDKWAEELFNRVLAAIKPPEPVAQLPAPALGEPQAPPTEGMPPQGMPPVGMPPVVPPAGPPPEMGSPGPGPVPIAGAPPPMAPLPGLGLPIAPSTEPPRGQIL